MVAQAYICLSAFLCLRQSFPPVSCLIWDFWLSVYLFFYFILPIFMELYKEYRKQVGLGSALHGCTLIGMAPSIGVGVRTTQPLTPVWKMSAHLMAAPASLN